MSPAEAAAFLRRYNEWRRTDDRYGMPYPDPREIGEAIDAAVEMIERLEAAEKERDTLKAKIERMEKQEPVMWANSSTINSSRINKERGGRGDQHTCSETQTAYHDTQLYALPGAQTQGE